MSKLAKTVLQKKNRLQITHVDYVMHSSDY